ncbi:MAG TPA: response regulator transcription factor [Candidatus Limnocylindria bacterium]
MKILLVEDDLDLLDVTAYSLRRERFAVIEATDGAQALHRWKVDRPDLMVLDLGLPRHDGFEVLQRVREKDTTPIVVLSGRGNEQDIFRAFTLGADDFVAKPFAAKHLALRIRAILRRSSAEPLEQSEPTLVLGDILVDPEVQEVRWADSYIRLTPTEFRIFHILAMHVGRIVTTSRLLAYVWGYEGGDPNALRTHISHLRTKLDLRAHGAAISGVPGVGYRFIASTADSNPEAEASHVTAALGRQLRTPTAS